MKTYITDRSKGYYTPYQQDMDDIAFRKNNRMSATAKVVFILIWFILLAIFW